MSKLAILRNANTKEDLANILNISSTFLTYTLYGKPLSKQYTKFEIPKKSGGVRKISAPSGEVKEVQQRLNILLLDCIDEMNSGKRPSTLSHGFMRNRSIITNAKMHTNKRNVLNIDISNFFESFNFGRVRGFFIKNNNFKLSDNIATVIAQISCYENSLPQGSPSSPVITNLIMHSLDIRLASIAKKYGCTYSRYADDITFSTRKKIFPSKLAKVNADGSIAIGKILNREICRSGFEINKKKNRLQFSESRQDVTGLTVNKKVNVNSQYWRNVRSMCHSLFMTGSYFIDADAAPIKGNIFPLYGMLNFIDQIDKYNHTIDKPYIEKKFEPKKYGLDFTKRLNVREKTL